MSGSREVRWSGSGGVVSYDGDRLVAAADDIIDAVESQLLGASATDRRDRWLLPDVVPALSRGDAWIIPLFWLPPSGDLAQEQRAVIDQRASELGQSMMSACWYRHGDPLGVDLDDAAAVARPYAAELARTGARDASWWDSGGHAFVLVHYGEPSPAPKSRMALQVVPVGWVSSRRPTAPKKLRGLDLAWSGADVVEFAAADSLSGQSKEDHGS